VSGYWSEFHLASLQKDTFISHIKSKNLDYLSLFVSWTFAVMSFEHTNSRIDWSSWVVLLLHVNSEVVSIKICNTLFIQLDDGFNMGLYFSWNIPQNTSINGKLRWKKSHLKWQNQDFRTNRQKSAKIHHMVIIFFETTNYRKSKR